MKKDATDLLDRIWNRFDPKRAADQGEYEDLTAARGGDSLVTHVVPELRRAEKPQCRLFTGHIGCGKSSELKYLERRLNAEPDRGSFWPVYVDADDFVDPYDAEMTEVLLAVVGEVAAKARAEKVELKDNYFVKRWEDLRKLILSDVELTEMDVGIGEAGMKFRRFVTDASVRQRVRDALLPRMSNLIEEVNSVFSELKRRLSSRHIVVVLDSMEKVQRVRDREQGMPSLERLFIQGAATLTRLNVHLICTVPLSLVRSHGPQIAAAYGSAPFVMPMVKVTKRGRPDERHDGGYEILRRLMAQRVYPASLDQVFDKTVLDWLIRYSGGHVRSLMQFAQAACTYEGKLPLSMDSAHKAIRQHLQLYATSVPQSVWQKLARIEVSGGTDFDNADPDARLILEQLFAMEYVNGDESDGAFDMTPWYSVNPIIRELRQFKEAVASARP